MNRKPYRKPTIKKDKKMCLLSQGLTMLVLIQLNHLAILNGNPHGDISTAHVFCCPKGGEPN